MNAREGAGRVMLVLPPNALPTLSALFSRTLTIPSDSVLLQGTTLVADALTGRPAWALSYPSHVTTGKTQDPSAWLVLKDRALTTPWSELKQNAMVSAQPLAVHFLESRPGG